MRSLTGGMSSIKRVNRKSIIDVRTQEEFATGHVPGSRNIPLRELRQRLEEIKDLVTPVILCCATGKRSALAEEYLQRNRVKCINAGPWTDVALFFEATRSVA